MALACRDPLEKLLREPPTLATNVIDFLLLAGIKGVRYHPLAPAYDASTRLDLMVKARRQVEENGRPDRVRALEGRMGNALKRGYDYGHYRSLGEFKGHIGAYHLKDFGPDSAARFNKWLATYGLEPFCDETRCWKPGRRFGPYYEPCLPK